jgi:UDP-N-acetylglucosamine acyltransferase
MATRVSSRASVDRTAELDSHVSVAPSCVIGPRAKIGHACRLEEGVRVGADVTLGSFNHIYAGAVIGTNAEGACSSAAGPVVMGQGNCIREAVRIEGGLACKDGATTLGSGNVLLADVRVGRGCHIGNSVILAERTTLEDHVQVSDFASLAMEVSVAARAVVGRYSYVSARGRVVDGVPPYMLAEGSPSRPHCVNDAGLRRHAFSPEAIDALREAHHLLFRTGMGVEGARAILSARGRLLPPVLDLFEFLNRESSDRVSFAPRQVILPTPARRAA